MSRIFTLLQKLSAGLRRIINSDNGGSFSVLAIGLAGFIVLVTVFLSIIDVSMYSYKKRLIAAGIDYGVSAAIQEINMERSREGLSRAFTEEGKTSMKGIYLDEARADKAFTSTIAGNLDINTAEIINKMIRVTVTPLKDNVYYNIKDKNGQLSGYTTNMNDIQNLLNTRMGNISGIGDSHTVYVNGNTSTNSFEERPYYMVFIRDYEIDGLFTNRKATFICFKGAKIYR